MQPPSPFQRVGIISRPRRSNLSVVVPPLLHWLEARGVEIFYDQETAGALHDSSKGLTREQVAEKSELIVVLGGDGTLLAAARVAAPLCIPLLPINMGSLGFLTSFKLEEMYPALEETLAGRLPSSERVMLDVELEREGEIIERQTVANEAVVNKGALSRMLDFDLYVDGDHVARYRADGLIVATPTGSTAYSLAAGGPIVQPGIDAFVITPICPHMLTNRPLVVPDTSRTEIDFSASEEPAYMTLDGQIGFELGPADRVLITKSENKVTFVRPPRKTYFEVLRSKLRWGER